MSEEAPVPKQACVPFAEICRDEVPLAGGKGANLGDMTQAGLPIPPGFVICAQAYRAAVEGCGLMARIDDLLSEVDPTRPDRLREVEREIRGAFEDVVIDEDLRDAILERYRALGTDARVAVRSSATAEDLAGASFAGQQETMLNVSGGNALLDAVRRCWSSLYTSQAIFYRCARGFRDASVSMAVVVQRMVAAEKSGVVFTVDPIQRNPYNMIVEAVWGLGEGVVSGTMTPDHYRVDRETYELVYEFIPDKRSMYRQDDEGGVVLVEVPADKVSARVLGSDELRQLVDLGNKVEEHFGSPQDIEWSLENGQIHLLQSRPITNL